MKTLKVKAKSLDVCTSIAESISKWGSKFHARYLKIAGKYYNNRTGELLVDDAFTLDDDGKVKPLKDVKLEKFN
ncbi:MAG: hypothetical protein IPL34_20385 [Thiofilum sp.]|uniref:hypothetical protein n=1 Tax=Thiofilum sp. TaxID=2212733 RepID=UPI0025D13DA7|nr:hypothetical protein [Thiofilum sp.]MBK8455641.1 hypothetical protein [Thiofilum sp.]